MSHERGLRHVGADFSMSVGIGDDAELTEKEQSLLEMVASLCPRWVDSIRDGGPLQH
jgi:hypothetical protein